MRCKQIISFLLLLISARGFSQNFTNKGREFWVGYGHHQYMEPSCDGSSPAPNDMNMVLYLSAEEPATVTVTIDSSGSTFVQPWKRTYIIPAYTVISTENLPKGSTDAANSGSDPNYDARLFDNAPPLGSGGENLWRKKGIHIESNVPIVAYAHIYGGVSSGATMLMPANTWGYSYTSVNSEQGGGVTSCYSWMYVIAKENNTMVQVTPSALSRRGRPAGVPFSVLLQKGQIYQLVGNADCPTGTGPELTGTTVKSIVGPDGKCHPVAVFAGSSRTGGEAALCGASGRDNDMQQLFPEMAWGKRYATAPFSKASGASLSPASFQNSVYKVVVKDPTTVVKRNGVTIPQSQLINNKYYKFLSGTADYIVADKPVMMAQFMSNGSSCGSGSDGDPEMIILSPVEQAIKQVGFYRNVKQSINSNFLTLVVPTAGVSSLRIDNSSTFGYTYPHPNLPGYTVVVKGWAASPSQCLVRCDSGFTAITYGMGSAESYGYNAGTYINNLSAVGSIRNTLDTANSSPFTCTRTPVELSILMAYQPLKMEWLLSGLSNVLTPNANVTVNAPVTIDSPLVNGIKYYKYTLPGSYQFSDTGTYNIRVVVTSPAVDNCTQSDTVGYTILVKGKPVADFTYTHSGCYIDTVYFTGSGSSGNYTINRWRWEFPNASFDSIRYPKRVFPVGTHNVKLQVISQEGCVGDTTKQIIIAAPPTTNFTVTPGTLCQPSSYSFASATGAGTGVSFYWDFGNGLTSTNSTNTATVTYPNYGTYTVKHVASQTGQCPSDTARKTITVFARPLVNFGFPKGCLAVDGTAQFRDSTINPDGQTLTYTWNFGDSANATAANPNTSTAQNPSHQYIAFGNYNIKLTVTSNNGCTKDTTIIATFAVRPTLRFGALNSVCTSNPVISVALGSVTNGVPGAGFYKGPGTDSVGNFNAAIAGPGVKTVWYVFTSSGGCTDSISQTIKVFPKPISAFTVSDSSFCQNVSTTIIPASSITSGTIKEWRWDFGSGPVTYSNNNPFTQSFTRPGPQTIRLYNISDSSCVSDTITRLINVNAVPGAAFGLTHTGCRLDTIYLTGSGSTANYTISSWKWNFSNGDTSILQNPRVLLPIGSNTIRLRVTTPEGCFKDTLQTITVFAPPIAALTGSPLSICEPGTTNFTDASNYGGNGSITGSYWDFGNGQNQNTTTNAAVSNLYTTYGTFTVKHVVKVSDLCVSDTARQIVRVFAKPLVNFTYPIGCLPASNIAQFTNTTTVPDGQVLTYAWNFGDLPSGNLNTSTLTNPTHQYNAYGQYDIKLSVSSANGCLKDTTIRVTFNVRPTLAFASLISSCINIASVSIANGSVTNGVPGTGIYRGPGTTTAGVFSPSTAGIGTHTIWYIFTSDAGCKDSVSRTIRVFPKPTAAFVLSQSAICADSSIAVTVQSAVPVGRLQSWNWNFGNGTAIYQNGNSFNLNYAPGTYTIRHYVVSDSSCVSDTLTQTVVIHPLPVANFTLPASICMPAGRAQFTNASTVSDNSTLSYTWNFGDQTPAVSNLSPLHIYGATGPYNVTLLATSVYGCKKDTTKILSTFYDQPVAAFTTTPEQLCQGTPSSFFDNSVATGSTISQWAWGFGDNSKSAQQNPRKSYNLPGSYTISLAVKSLQGCTSDTVYKTVNVYVQPRIDAGPSFLVPQGTLVRFAAIANDTTVQFRWTPATDLSNDAILTPSLIATGNASGSQTYTLTATGAANCTAIDTLTVKILRPLNIPNVFSPNGDGINDTWVIPNLGDYPGATVEVYDRYGKLVNRYTGYSRPWDGTINSKPLPIGTYYYVIDLKNGFSAMNGPVTIIR